MTRALVVTLGLTVTGALVGAVCGGVAPAVVAVAAGDWRDLLRPGFWVIGGIVGAAIGAVVAPVMSWLLLRRVPLGAAIGQTAAGTIAGGILGLIAGAPLIGAVSGFMAAAVRLSVVERRRRLRPAS